MTLRAATAALIGALALAAVHPALAQDGSSWAMIMPSITGTDALGTYFWNERHKNDPGGIASQTPRGQTPSPAPRMAAPNPPVSLASLRFTPSAERRRANFDSFVAARRGDAASRRQLEGLLRDPGFMPQVQAALAKVGLAPDNVADAYTIWWITAWQAAHGDVSDPSRASVQAVRRQAERVFLQVPAVTGADDAGKQAFADNLIVQAVVMGTVTEQVSGNPAQLRMIGQIARQNARTFGLDLDAVKLTEAGFVETAG